MNSATKPLSLPSLTTDLLTQTDLKIDNAFNSTWKSLGFYKRFKVCVYLFDQNKTACQYPINQQTPAINSRMIIHIA